MGFLGDRRAEAERLLTEQLQPLLRPGEVLVGAVHANEQKTFSTRLYALGVTPERLILLPVNRKLQPSGDPVRSITRADVRGCSVWGWGGSVSDFLSISSDQQIRIETPEGKLKLMVLGGNLLENALAGEGQLRGLDALVEFLRSARDEG